MKEVKIAIAGLGVVGGEVARILCDDADRLSWQAGAKLDLVAVSAREERDRGFSMDGIAFERDAAVLAKRDDIDIVVELIGGSDGVAFELCQKALNSGKHVVTANKAMVAHHGHDLAICAEGNGAQLCFEAAVAGGIPAIKLLREGLSANRIEQVTGILNGTCNYILTEMTVTGRSFGDVLAEAQAKGYAEAEPSFDVDGIDAAHKLAILAAIAYGRKIRFETVEMTGIRDISDTDIGFAADLGYVIKLLGTAARDGLPTVQPCLIAKDIQLAKIDGALNAVAYKGSPVESILCTGPGAGDAPTASAVLADIIDIARGHRAYPFGKPAASLLDSDIQKPVDAGRYYLRMMVKDEIGVLNAVTAILRDHEISVESMLQKGRSDNAPVHLVFTTHSTEHACVSAACTSLSGEKFVAGDILALPIMDNV